MDKQKVNRVAQKAKFLSLVEENKTRVEITEIMGWSSENTRYHLISIGRAPLRKVTVVPTYKHLYDNIVGSAQRRSIECDLTFDEFLTFVEEGAQCTYCGQPLRWAEGRSSKYSGYNLDRLDNAEGYRRENLVVCCPICNKTKNNTFTAEEFKIIGKAIQVVLESRAAT